MYVLKHLYLHSKKNATSVNKPHLYTSCFKVRSLRAYSVEKRRLALKLYLSVSV